MIRLATPNDMPALLSLAEAVGLFQPDQLDELKAILADYFNDTPECDRFWITDDDNGLVGVAYCEPEPMTDQTWNLQMLGVRPDCQGQGRGTALVRYVEQMLTAQGGRMLLVETSGVPEFERTRTFYTQCGYQEEARIRDFYAAGDDKVVFRRLLAPS